MVSLESVDFFDSRHAHARRHKGTATSSRRATAMEESKQLESSGQSDHNLRLSYYLKYFARSSSSNSVSDSNSNAEPFLYEPEVEQPLHFLRSLTMMKVSPTQSGEAKASNI